MIAATKMMAKKPWTVDKRQLKVNGRLVLKMSRMPVIPMMRERTTVTQKKIF
jgi:hypothetical protein